MDARQALERLIEERREDYAGLSRLLGRNPAYVQQYIKRGSPRILSEADRRTLCAYFGVAESVLGGPDASPVADANAVAVPMLDVGAAAGAGALGERERVRALLTFDARWLRNMGVRDAGALSIIRVEGDSMAPTLADGDEILVDRGDGAARMRDGIYVLRREEALIVKRVALGATAGTVQVASDNAAYPRWPELSVGALDIIGRVVWQGRRL